MNKKRELFNDVQIQTDPMALPEERKVIITKPVSSSASREKKEKLLQLIRESEGERAAPNSLLKAINPPIAATGTPFYP